MMRKNTSNQALFFKIILHIAYLAQYMSTRNKPKFSMVCLLGMSTIENIGSIFSFERIQSHFNRRGNFNFHKYEILIHFSFQEYFYWNWQSWYWLSTGCCENLKTEKYPKAFVVRKLLMDCRTFSFCRIPNFFLPSFSKEKWALLSCTFCYVNIWDGKFRLR